MSEPDVKSQDFETLVFPTHLMPREQTCDHLLHRIRDIFKLPQPQHETCRHSASSEHPIPPTDSSSPCFPPLQVGTLARVVCGDGAQSALLRCASAASNMATESDWEKRRASGKAGSPILQIFEMLPAMEVVVLELNLATDGASCAFVRVPVQSGFPQCQGQEGLLSSKHLVPVPALPPCTSVAVCLMRSVQRVALRVSCAVASSRFFNFHHASLTGTCSGVCGLHQQRERPAAQLRMECSQCIRALRRCLSRKLCGILFKAECVCF